ncbi:adenosylcobyric acid synthase [Mycolicibacterium iranicum]|uniref:Cobyric acid synthase n=1 Tax=Mycolicibacterium iranicum TaxID=912594 RepID=A0A839Q192_MYCIR|nr:cobyric acid synthase [Mycolicibacterium iranicum]MBB2988714.1 adenosylcobyric acid synthase [Mycolicibacterium iranicum]
MTGLLIAGTTSDAGKSVVTTGLCRALARRGVKVAPYKAQNMSNNSMVCSGADGQGVEIGRAQWIQALAARATPEAAMNPVLLKPGSDRRSHVVLMGQPWGHVSSSDWLEGRRALAAAAHAAYDDLASRYEVVVAEGAGSPAEINLRAGDYVNLGLARHAGLPTVVVGDIDRGGVFAAFFGTVALLSAEDQALVAGFVVNKFRGDLALLDPGLRDLEKVTGRRVYGTLPWHPDIWLDSEDALDLQGRRSPRTGARRVVVVRLPRISNFTDVDALGIEPDLDVVFASHPGALADADLVVLPGTRSTIADLAWLRSRGLDRAVLAHAAQGRPVLGICGGFQMLGRVVQDRDGIEGPPTEVDGLGLLDAATDFAAEKTLRLPRGFWRDAPATGYEIHHGRITTGGGAEEFLGGTRAGNVYGTMWHGALEGDALRALFLQETLGVQSAASFGAARESRLDLLGDLVERHLDVAALLDLAREGVAQSLPFLPPGAP